MPARQWWRTIFLLLPMLCGLTAPALAQSYATTDYGPLCASYSEDNNSYACDFNGTLLASSSYKADFSSYTAEVYGDTVAICSDVIRQQGVEPVGPDVQVLAGCSIDLSIWFDGQSNRGDKVAWVGIHGEGNREGQDFTRQYLGKGHLAVQAIYCGCWLRQHVPD